MAHAHADSSAVSKAATDATAGKEQIPLQCLTHSDRTAFWEIWDLYRNDHLSRCSLLWMQGNHADAEDALSSSAVKACQYLADASQEIVCFKGWLTRLLHNHCMDVWKTRQRHHRYRQGRKGAVSQLMAGRYATPSEQESAEETLLQHELGAHIRRALDNLPPRLREPSFLRFVYDMPYEEIAAQLNLRSDNVRKRVQQARILLQQQLAAYCSDGQTSLGDASGFKV